MVNSFRRDDSFLFPFQTLLFFHHRVLFWREGFTAIHSPDLSAVNLLYIDRTLESIPKGNRNARFVDSVLHAEKGPTFGRLAVSFVFGFKMKYMVYGW